MLEGGNIKWGRSEMEIECVMLENEENVMAVEYLVQQDVIDEKYEGYTRDDRYQQSIIVLEIEALQDVSRLSRPQALKVLVGVRGL